MKILVVENGNEIYTSEELLDSAKKTMSKEKINGYIGNLMYYRQIKGDYTLVSFVDNSLNQKNLNNLLKYSIYKTIIRITHNARDNHYRISGKMDSCIEK